MEEQCEQMNSWKRKKERLTVITSKGGEERIKELVKKNEGKTKKRQIRREKCRRRKQQR